MVDIGDDEKLVIGALELYKFCWPGINWPLELSNDSADLEVQANLPDSLAKARLEFEKIFRDIGLLSEAEQQKVVKRLYLRWHPDKNPGNEDLCKEVFKFLKEEIVKLDQLKEFSEVSPTPFHDWFLSWNNQAIAKEMLSRDPDPEESDRWKRQAESDLTAAKKALSTFTSQVINGISTLSNKRIAP